MKILTIQNRMGIGDMVIFLPYIEAISKKFDTPVSILVKENSKAIQFLGDNKNIDEIIILDRGNKKKNSRHDGFGGSLSLANDLRKRNFDKVFIFNSSFRFNLISRIAGIKKIYQYPLFRKKNQHIINTAEEFLKKEIQVDVKSDPQILINKDDISEAKSKYKIQNSQLNILLGIGVLFIIIGLFFMQGGGSEDPAIYNEEMFNFQRITLAPILIVSGFIINVFAILYSKKEI